MRQERVVIFPECVQGRAPNERSGMRNVIAKDQVAKLVEAVTDEVRFPRSKHPEGLAVFVHKLVRRVHEAHLRVLVQHRDVSRHGVIPTAVII
jgi:hypothetical protein